MPAASDHLSEIYAQIQDIFSGHPHIEVRPTRGNPPDQYEVRYSISGLQKNEADQVVETDDLAIEIAIPFGFPHFPPSCKPKSPIFHPDFDPAAICLGDFWEASPSLPELIIHLGKMLNGETYSDENAFDEDAADWYRSNPDRFPLSSVRWESDSGDGEGRTLEPVLDVLDDQDLDTDLDFDGSDIDDFDSGSLPQSFELERSEATEKRLEKFTTLLNQKKLYTLSSVKEDTVPFTDNEQGLLTESRKKVALAKIEHQKASDLEENGKAAEALKLYKSIRNTVADFPGIATDLRRTEQALELLREIQPDAEIVLEKESKEQEATESQQAKHPPTAQPQPKTRAQKSPPKKRSISLPGGKPLLLFLLFGFVAAGGGYGYLVYNAQTKLSQAQQEYLSCKKGIAEKSFTSAQKACSNSRDFLNSIYLVEGSVRDSLLQKIDDLTGTEEFRQGVQGKVRYGDVFISVQKAQLLAEFDAAQTKASNLEENQQWKEAVATYSSLLQKLSALPEYKELSTQIQHKLHIAHYRQLKAGISAEFKAGKWEEVIKQLHEVDDLLPLLEKTFQENESIQLQEIRLTSQLQILKSKADTYFTSSDWDHAIDTYRELFTIVPQNSSLGNEQVSNIKVRLIKAQLYKTVSSGNQAFAGGDWEKAIDAYSSASEILLRNAPILGEVASRENHRKLARVILQARTIRDKQRSQDLLDKGKKEEAQAVLKKMTSRLESSDFSEDEEFSTLLTDNKARIKTLEKEIFIEGREKYLKKNYRNLFAANYPVASLDNLIRPVITFVREEGANVIFKLQCTETGRGRPLNLVMYYGWNKKSGKWALFAGEMD